MISENFNNPLDQKQTGFIDSFKSLESYKDYVSRQADELTRPLDIPADPDPEFNVAVEEPKLNGFPDEASGNIGLETAKTNIKGDFANSIEFRVVFPSGFKNSKHYPDFRESLFFKLKDMGSISRNFGKGNQDINIKEAVSFKQFKEDLETYFKEYSASLPANEDGNGFSLMLDDVKYTFGKNNEGGDTVVKGYRKKSAKELIRESRPEPILSVILKELFSIIGIEVA